MENDALVNTFKKFWGYIMRHESKQTLKKMKARLSVAVVSIQRGNGHRARRGGLRLSLEQKQAR